MPLAGGTDLLPNMKRRQQVPRTLMSLRHIEDLSAVQLDHSAIAARRLPHARGHRGGSSLSKRSDGACASRFSGGHAADSKHGDARRKSLPRYALQLLRSELRVAEGDQFLPEKRWRHLLGRARKSEVRGGIFDGHRARADCAWRARPPRLAFGEREVLLADLYNNDGIDYIKRRPDEILAEVLLDSLHGWKSTYWKLRRRGSFDFPVLSVAAAARLSATVWLRMPASSSALPHLVRWSQRRPQNLSWAAP